MLKKGNLLYLVPKFDICYDEKGSTAKPHGGTAHVRGFIFNISEYFKEVHVICKKEGKGKDVIKKGNVTIHRIKIPGLIYKKKTNPLSAIIKTFFYVKKLDKTKNFKIIYEREEFSSGAGTLLKILSFGKKKLVLEINSPHVEEAIYRKDIPKVTGFIFKLLEDFQLLFADKIITTIPSLVPKWALNKTYFTEWSGGEGIKRGAEKKFKGKKIVCFLGSMSYWHGAELLAEVANEINKKRKDIYFLFIGKGRDYEKIKELARRNKNIILTGTIKDKELSSYLESATICVAPFDYSNYLPLKKYGFYWSPIKLFDYMKIGKPIITSEMAGRIVTKEIGVTYKNGDKKDLEKKILKLIDDKKRIEKLGKNAFEKWKKNSWKMHSKMIYEKVLKKLNL